MSANLNSARYRYTSLYFAIVQTLRAVSLDYLSYSAVSISIINDLFCVHGAENKSMTREIVRSAARNKKKKKRNHCD